MFTIAFMSDIISWNIVNSVCGPHLHGIVVKPQGMFNDDISSHRPPSVIQCYHLAGNFVLA